MPALLPILATASFVVLASDKVPKLDIGPTCRAAATSGVTADRSEESCKRDEDKARAQLANEWNGFSVSERRRCTSLSHRGGSPSYVELLTCLEVAKQSKELPEDSGWKGSVER